MWHFCVVFDKSDRTLKQHQECIKGRILLQLFNNDLKKNTNPAGNSVTSQREPLFSVYDEEQVPHHFYFENVFMRHLRTTMPRTTQAATCTLEAMVMKVITYQWVPRHIGDIFQDRKTWRHLCWKALSWTGFNVPLWSPSVFLCQLSTRWRAEAKAITSYDKMLPLS